MEASALLSQIISRLGKHESIPYACVFAVVVWFALICGSGADVKEDEDDNALHKMALVSIFVGAILLIYILICLIADGLPKAGKNSIGVLFDVEAESDKIYESIKYKLADNFQNLSIHENAPPFDAVCVKRKRIQRYYKGDTELIVKLLKKTRCVIKVEVRCTVDDVTQAENYSLAIHYDILDPSISEEVKRMLAEDVHPLGKSVEKLHFGKTKTIENFDFTAQTLVNVCQYMVGCVYLFKGHTQEAIDVLGQLKKTLELNHQEDERISHLKELLNRRLFLCYNELVHSNLKNFERTKELAYLKTAQGALEEQNQLYPNTYAYCLNMSYTAIALNRDSKTAKDCIDMCKTVKYDYAWTYSDAFLSAYSGAHPMVIRHKYAAAIEHPTETIIDVIDYIEFVIDREPDKAELHLAVGFLYEAAGDIKQMKRHFSQFMAQYSSLDSRTSKYLKNKMNSCQCADHCNNDCLNCG